MSKDLFQLIKSLSPTEKRYFKVNATSGNQATHYLRLFDVMDKMEDYNEKRIQRKIRNESFADNLHVTKNYLYQVILRTLRNYYEKNSVDLKLHSLLVDVIILYQKGQYSQAGKLLQKLKKQALKYDNQWFLLAALRQEIKLALTEPKKLGNEVTKICSQLTNQLRIFENEFQLYALRSRLVAAQRAHYTLSEILPNEKLDNHPLLQTSKFPENFYNVFLFHRTRAVYHHLLKERKQAFEHYQKIIVLWENHEHIINDKPFLYKIQLSNYLAICHELSQYDNFTTTISKIKSLPSQSFDEEAESFQNVAYFELLYYMNTLQLDEAQLVVPQIKKGLKRFAPKISKARLIAFWYNISILFFASEDYEKALDWLTNILNEPKTEHRQDLQHFARFLELLFHFELNNLELFHYLLRSLSRRISLLEKSASSLDLLLIQQFKLLPNLKNKKETLHFFKSFQKKLDVLPVPDRKLPGGEEISIWLSTKVSGLSFLKVMHQRFGHTDK